MSQTFTPSPQQADFFNWITTGSGSCVLEAVAGAGKTTTLEHGVRLMGGTVFLGAYNKAIADEIRARIGARPGLVAGTMHSAGFSAWRRVAGGVKIDGNKCRTIFREASARNAEYRPFESSVLSLVSYAKQTGLGALKGCTLEDFDALAEHHSVEPPAPEAAELMYQLASRTLRASIERDFQVIDFDDMIYAPLRHEARLFTSDWVLIDEAQDTNATRRALALRMLKPGGRLVAVGDPRQAIYGFTGADADALDLIAAATGAVRMPLTITYRCPKKVVEVAHQWVKHITAAASAPDGEVHSAPVTDLKKHARPGDAVLCRFVAPLIRNVYSLIADGVPARVEGREIGEGLRKLATRWKTDSIAQFLGYLETYETNEVAKLQAKEKERAAEALIDKCACVRVVVGRVKAKDPKAVMADVLEAITTLFGAEDNPTAQVTFSTIHRSKGREWHRVLWLVTGPSPYARKAWEQVQEANLCYVAATRAKAELFLLQ